MEIAAKVKKLALFYLEIMEPEDDPGLIRWQGMEPRQAVLWRRGKAALAVAPPELDVEKVWARFVAVARACREWQAGPRPVEGNFMQALERLSGVRRKEFLGSLLGREGREAAWAGELRVSAALLEFIALHAFKPLLRDYGRRVGAEMDLAAWTGGCCPVCGDRPAMAKFAGPQGLRKLYCGCCETQWRYKRLGCPYCRDDNASRATFLTLAEYKQYRIYLCHRCNSYLKTVDERVCGEVDLFCEDLATVYLDGLARAEGYRRGDGREWI